MQKQKSNKIRELQHFIDKFDTETDKSVIMEAQKKQIKEYDFLLIQKEDELRGLVNSHRAENLSLQESMQSS